MRFTPLRAPCARRRQPDRPSDRRGPPRWGLGAIAGLLLLAAGAVWPAEIDNSATGTADGVPLNPASVSLNRVGGVVSRAMAEISPNQVLANSRTNALTYDILPTIQAGDTGIGSLQITAPPGWSNLSVSAVWVGGTPLSESCPTPGTGECCTSIAAGVITIALGDKIATDQTAIRVELSADAPVTPGPADFPSAVADGATSMPTFVGDADNDPGDANSITVEVLQTQGLVLELVKHANKRELLVGGVVTYSVIVKNTVDYELIGVRVEDRIPPNFKYVGRSARLDGAPLADPTGNRTLVFDIGNVPALVDDNANGSADPGESGYRVLTYQLVVGSGARPGVYENVAVAKDFCDDCRISNEARAQVEVTVDPLLDLATIIGKVFEDRNRDGVQDPDEPGMANVMVALDDGTYALTDEFGRYHFPAVYPGWRMVKPNLHSLPPGSRFTAERSQIIWVPRGLMARASFGVELRQDLQSIGQAGTAARRVELEQHREPIQIVGHAPSMALLVNGKRVPLPSGDVRLELKNLDGVVRLQGERLLEPVRFKLNAEPAAQTRSWTLEISDWRKQVVRRFSGEGPPPASLDWDARTDDGRLVDSGAVYRYRLALELEDGSTAASPRHTFGVNRKSVIELTLSGGTFQFNSDVLTERAKRALAEAAESLRQIPDQQVVVEGHTDSVGADEYNQALSQRRAEAVVRHLVEAERLPGKQFIVEAYGESRPVASNDDEEGRALNRRVEIHGQREEVDAAPAALRGVRRSSATVGGVSIELDDSGRFRGRTADEGQRSLDVELADERGRRARAEVPMPALELSLPSGEMMVPVADQGIGEDGDTGCRVVGGAAPDTHRCTIAGRTEPGNAVTLDGRPLEVRSDGTFTAELPMRSGANTFGLVATNPQGFTRIVTVRMQLAAEDENGQPYVLSETIPNLTVLLPPEGTDLTVPELRLSGHTDPGNTLSINGQSVPVDERGDFVQTVKLPVGQSELELVVTDDEGHQGRIVREVQVARHQLFLLAFADAKFSQIRTSGLLEGSGQDERDQFEVDGRAAFYLKGRIAGKYLITAAYDSGKRELGQLFDSIDRDKNRLLLRNLDPDKFYPVYGDQSTLVYDAQTQGKFYLALEAEQFNALVGNYVVALGDTELAAYRRTLYGAKFDYRSKSQTRAGEPDTRIVVFGAEMRQAHIHDELRATGGSVYYLSHDRVIEGSEQVSLVIRDKHTGLLLRRDPQRQNLDYTIKYEEGRVFFHRPVSSVFLDGSVVDTALLSGHPVFIHVDYEAQLDSLDETGGGARVEQQLGERASVGATYVQDQGQAGEYELQAIDAEVRLGRHSRLLAEYAESKGSDGLTFLSEDGGVTYTPVDAGGVAQGSAYKAALEVDIGEFFGRPERYVVQGYYKELEPGFFSSGNFQEQGTRKTGASASLKLSERDDVVLRHDTEGRSGATTAGSAAESTIESVRWSRNTGRWKLDVELFSRRTRDPGGAMLEDSRLGAVRFWSKITDKLSAHVEHQQSLSGPDKDQTTLGAEYQLLDSLALEAKATEGAQGSSTQLGAVATFGDSRIYVAERVGQDSTGDRNATVIGAERSLGKGSKVYTEYQHERADRGDRTLSLVGLQKQWELSPGFRLLFTGESANVDASSGERERASLGASLSYTKQERIRALFRNEVRFEDGTERRVQYLTSSQFSLQLDADWSLVGKWRYSKTEDRDTDLTEARFEERTLGFAYRPIHNDRFNALGKYTRLVEQRPLALGSSEISSTAMDVLSFESIYDVNRRLEWSAKLAARSQTERVGNRDGVDSNTYLGIQRFNVRLWKPLGLGVEYRLLHQDLADDSRRGWLTELTWSARRDLRLGLGFNFTDFSDNELSLNDYSVRGWFFRIQGRY